MVKKALITTALKYGLAGGILIITPFLLLLKMDQKPLVNLNTLILEGMLMFIFIYFGAREFRDKKNDGILKFWQGMTSGFIIYVVMASVFVLFLWTYINILNPDFISNYKVEALEYLRDSIEKINDPEEKELLSQQMSTIEETTNADLILDSLVKKIVLGLVLTPICTVFLRRY